MSNSEIRRNGQQCQRTLLLIAAFVFVGVLTCQEARPQTPSNAAVQQARWFQERPDSQTSTGSEQLSPLAEPLTGGQSAADQDLGEQWMLKRNLPANPFTAHASFSLFYTDNVALAHRPRLGDGFGVAEIGIGYRRTFAVDWAFAIDLQQSFFRYNRYTEFDFESGGVNVALSYQARSLGGIFFSLQYNLNRLTSGSADDQLYLGNSFALAATKVVQINSAQTVDFTGSLGYTFADPDDLERAELRFAIGYSVQLARNFSATAAVRLELYDYTNDAREDLLQVISLGARYDINDWFFVSASLSGANNISTVSVFSYTALNLGITLAAHVRF